MRKRPSKTLPSEDGDTYAEYNGPASEFRRGFESHKLVCFLHGDYLGCHAATECPTCDQEDH